MHESPTSSPTTHEHTHERVDPETVDWDERYRADDQVWSGHPNGSLVDEVTGHTPGRALDVGCGEGADAIWLAEQGWTVTAVDVAPTAIERGRAEAERQGLTVDWVAGDLLAGAVAGEFDLVALHYPAFPIASAPSVAAALAGAVAVGGELLLVGHAFPEDPDSIPFDPTEWVQPADIVAALPSAFAATVDETRPRPGDHHAGSPRSHDVIVRLQRG